MKEYHRDIGRKPREFQKGDRVWVEGQNITTTRLMKKLDDKRYRPFEVLRKVGEGAYKLKIPSTWQGIHNVFHEDILTPHNEPRFIGQKKPDASPPEIINEHLKYEVKTVLDKRIRYQQTRYLIEWEGYPNSTDYTWEPLKNLENAGEAIKEYKDKHQTHVSGVTFSGGSTVAEGTKSRRDKRHCFGQTQCLYPQCDEDSTSNWGRRRGDRVVETTTLRGGYCKKGQGNKPHTIFPKDTTMQLAPHATAQLVPHKPSHDEYYQNESLLFWEGQAPKPQMQLPSRDTLTIIPPIKTRNEQV
jgi:hypothetical protein